MRFDIAVVSDPPKERHRRREIDTLSALKRPRKLKIEIGKELAPF
jgi:hypothetical protein